MKKDTVYEIKYWQRFSGSNQWTEYKEIAVECDDALIVMQKFNAGLLKQQLYGRKCTGVKFISIIPINTLTTTI